MRQLELLKIDSQAEQVRHFVATNSHGSANLFCALKPLLRKGARYAMIASSFGQLRRLHESLRPLFDTAHLTIYDIEDSMDQYTAAIQADRAADQGWPEWINVPSKIGQVATARIAAHDISQERPRDGILINAICPGLMDTDASHSWFDDMSDAVAPADAAQPVVDFLLLPAGLKQPNGQLLHYGRVLPWL